MQQSITVMVTGIGGGSVGEQLIKALRLAQTDYTIIGTDMSSRSKGFMEVDHAYLVPKASEPNYIDSLIAICRECGVRVLLVGSEPELKVVSQFRDSIQEAGVFLPINPQPVIELCLNKKKTIDALLSLGFAAPRTRIVSSPEDMHEADFYPAVVKPITNSSGSADVFIVQNPKELEDTATYFFSKKSSFLIQEYIGSAEMEFTVGVLISMDGELINSIAVKRDILGGLSNRTKVPNRSNNKKLGDLLAISSGISQGMVGQFSQVTKPCEEIALSLGCRGAVNIQCRYSEGKVFVFEINPRFSGTTSLRAMAGYNEPDVLIRKHLLSQTVKPGFPYKSGYIVRGLQETFLDENLIIKAINVQ